jgi:anti-anti-sigma regulatory factor
MLRITVAGPTVSLVVHLDGKLTGPWVEEARSAISTALTTNSLCINLQNLSFADDAGIALLRGYRRDLIPLIGGSPWIEQLLACDPQESSGR